MKDVFNLIVHTVFEVKLRNRRWNGGDIGGPIKEEKGGVEIRL